VLQQQVNRLLSDANVKYSRALAHLTGTVTVSPCGMGVLRCEGFLRERGILQIHGENSGKAARCPLT
jgi:hypothetical protein